MAKKLSERVLNDKDFEDIKIRFNGHMVRYHAEKANYMDLFKCWHAIYNTDTIKENPEESLKKLESVVGFLALSPQKNDQQDMMHRLKIDENIEKLPSCLALLKMFTNKELIVWADLESGNKASLFGRGTVDDGGK